MTSVPTQPSFVGVVSKSGVDTQNIHALNLPLAQVQAKMTGAVSALGGEPLTLSTIAIQAALYHLKAEGQQVRARIALGACRALNVETTDAVTLAAAIELPHRWYTTICRIGILSAAVKRQYGQNMVTTRQYVLVIYCCLVATEC
jgi:hypothetical protein